MENKIATALFLNKDKKILLYLRDNKPSIPYPNSWAILGGHAEENENILDALKREIKEEIEYELENEKIFFIDKFDDGVGGMVYVYKSGIDKKIEELKLNEGQKLGFFNFEEAIELEIPEKLRDFLIKNKEKIFF